jgi:hypothetical protein
MFMKDRALLVVMALSAALVAGMFATGCGGDDSDSTAKSAPAATASTSDKANPPKSNRETGAFRKVAFKACTNSVANERVPADTAEAYCACAVDELVKSVSAEEMAQVGKSGDENLPTDVEMELTDAIVTCADISSIAGH